MILIIIMFNSVNEVVFLKSEKLGYTKLLWLKKVIHLVIFRLICFMKRTSSEK